MAETDPAHNLATLLLLSATRPLDALRSAIPLASDREWAKGSARRSRTAGPHLYSGLEFESKIERSAAPHLHLQDLLDRIEPATGAIGLLADELDADDREPVPVRVWLHVTAASGGEPRAEITREQLGAIVDLGASLDVTMAIPAPIDRPPTRTVGASLVDDTGPGSQVRAHGTDLRHLLDQVQRGDGPEPATTTTAGARVDWHLVAPLDDEAAADLPLAQVRALVDLGVALTFTAEFPRSADFSRSDATASPGPTPSGR